MLHVIPLLSTVGEIEDFCCNDCFTVTVVNMTIKNHSYSHFANMAKIISEIKNKTGENRENQIHRTVCLLFFC